MHISSLSILYLLLFICLISFISSHTPIWILATHGCSDIDKFYIRNLIVITFSYKKMQRCKKELRTKINSFSSFVLILQKTPLWNALISLHKAATQTLFCIHLFSPTQYGPIFLSRCKRLYVWAGHLPVFGKTLLLKNFWSWVKELVEFPLLNGREGKYLMRNKETWNYTPSTRLFLTSKKRVQGIIVLWYWYCTSGVVIRIPWFSPLTRSTTLGLQAEHGDHYR